MPIPLPPKTYVCNNCNWKKTIHFDSDVIMPWQVIHICQKCHSPNLSEKFEKPRRSLFDKLFGG